MKKRNWPYRNDGLAMFFLALLVVVLHHSALSGSWRWDDGMHLLHTTQYSWTSVFLDPEVLRSVSGNQFAPWNIFIYYVNGALFGFSERLYYAHHLLSLWGAAACLYALLRQWLPARRAWISPALLLAGVPAFQMAQQLMVGHYIEGLLFASAGLALQIRAVRAWGTTRGQALALSLGGALLYGLACLCKEIYVPWILLWLVAPWTLVSFPKRVALCAAPALLVALLYTLARLELFDGSGAYYGGGTSNWEVAALLRSLASIPAALLGNGVRGAMALALVFLSLYAGSRHFRIWGLLFASALVVTLVPLVFLAANDPLWGLHTRYLWAPWLLFCLAWSIPWQGVLQRLQWFAPLLFAGLAAWQVVLVRPEDQKLEAMFDSHFRMVLAPPAGATHWVPAEFNGPGYLTFVSYAAREAMQRTGYPLDKPPELLRHISMNPEDYRSVLAWDPLCNCFGPFLELTPEVQAATVTRVRGNKGMLLPGVHPLADAYQGPAPEMRVEGNRLYVSGTAPSEGGGHVLALGGWAPSKMVSSLLTTETQPGAPAVQAMKFDLVLEARDAAAAQHTQENLCVLTHSQTHPYTFVALDAAAPTTACRKLLTPWALRQPATQR